MIVSGLGMLIRGGKAGCGGTGCFGGGTWGDGEMKATAAATATGVSEPMAITSTQMARFSRRPADGDMKSPRLKHLGSLA